MSKSENRQDSGGNDNDSRRQILRSEKNWRELLVRAENETERFLKIYTGALRDKNAKAENFDPDYDRLDACALAMGWHLSADDDSESAEFDGNEPERPTAEFAQVYSLHNLPECIAISALFKFANAHWAALWEIVGEKISAKAAAALMQSLSEAKRNMMLAIDAEDALEFGLAVCLMKNAHAALNKHFSEMEALPETLSDKKYFRVVRELRAALLDLRDICLRIIRDSRSEMQNRTH